MKILLVGPPGSGKGTVSSFLIEKYGLKHISTGEVLRKAIDEGTELGKLAKSLIDRGEFVPDDVAVAIVKEELQLVNDYVLDGFPRNEEQAATFDTMLKAAGEHLDLVIVLELEDEVIIERLKNRRECEGCKATYHLINLPPKQEGVCDRCNGTLVTRKDDANVEKRLETYRNKTVNVATHYEKQKLTKKIYAGRSIADVRQDVSLLMKSMVE